jgi:plasmid replication initiation protein
MTKLKRYKPTAHTRVSPKLYDKTYRTKLSLHAQKLLYGLASCLDESEDLFPEWVIHIDGLFKYLNIENTNKRYDIVRESILEIAKNPLEYRLNEKKWGVWAWISMAKFDAENSNFVTINFSPEVKPFLLQLKEYCRLEVRYYMKLSSNYSMWLYPYLRNVANKRDSYIEMTLKEIRELTYNEKTPAYNPKKNKDANRNLLARVVGIERKRGAKHYTPVMTVTTDGEIRDCGAVAEINEKTDLLVNCDVIKDGRSLHAVRFNVQFKPETYQGKRKAIKKAHRTDYKNPDARQLKFEEIKEGKIEGAIPMKTAKDLAKAAGKTVGDFMREQKYIQYGGKAIKQG